MYAPERVNAKKKVSSPCFFQSYLPCLTCKFPHVDAVEMIDCLAMSIYSVITNASLLNSLLQENNVW